nr:translation initiation factor IF-2-like [Macaca fascicularis]XP_045225751.1 translation initiation factor IF-2-like [Macaca fascicularis]
MRPASAQSSPRPAALRPAFLQPVAAPTRGVLRRSSSAFLPSGPGSRGPPGAPPPYRLLEVHRGAAEASQPGPVTRVASAASGRGGRSPTAGNARSEPRIPCACAAGNQRARGRGSAKPAAPSRTIFVSYS